VTEAIEYEQFDPAGAPAGTAGTPGALDADLSRLADIPMELSVEIGRTHMTVGETLDLRVGSVVTLERLAGQTADLLVNGTPIARGEVVVVDEQYGLRISEILDSQQDGDGANGAHSAARSVANATHGAPGASGGAPDALDPHDAHEAGDAIPAPDAPDAGETSGEEPQGAAQPQEPAATVRED
jgi:flagellar motor switch protein FliN